MIKITSEKNMLGKKHLIYYEFSIYEFESLCLSFINHLWFNMHWTGQTCSISIYKCIVGGFRYTMWWTHLQFILDISTCSSATKVSILSIQIFKNLYHSTGMGKFGRLLPHLKPEFLQFL